MHSRYKLTAAAFSALIILSSCGNGGSSAIPKISSDTDISDSVPAEIYTQSESVEDPEETHEKTAPDDDGLLSSVRRIIDGEFGGAQGYSVSAGLYDFDTDGVPEVYSVRSNGGQGFMPIEVYSLDGGLLGELSGYCRDGYTRFYNIGNDVYMHSFYEHSVHQRVETVDRIICENGSISSVPVTGKFGYTRDRFPILEYTYYADGEETDEKTYYDRYSDVHWEADRLVMTNGVSIFAGRGFESSRDFQNENYPAEMAEYICGVYRSYENGKRAAIEYTGCEPYIYAFDDYDGDGRYEAFMQVWEAADKRRPELYFYDGEKITQLTEPNISENFYWFERTGRYFIAQPLGNSNPCRIFGVEDGTPFEPDISGSAMQFGRSVYSEFTIGDYVLEDSDFEPSHTHKSYLFDCDLNEQKGVPVTAEFFSDDELVYEDVKAAFEQIEADGGQVEGAYLRGGRYLNINYSYPANGDINSGIRLPGYKTYIVQNYVTLVEEGEGNYKASITEHSVYPVSE